MAEFGSSSKQKCEHRFEICDIVIPVFWSTEIRTKTNKKLYWKNIFENGHILQPAASIQKVPSDQ